MASIEYVATLMNVHGMLPDPMGLVTGGPPFDPMEVWGSLGLGKMSPEAMTMGMAIYCPDDRVVLRAQCRAFDQVARMFVDNGWDGTTPFKRQVRALEGMRLIEDYDTYLAHVVKLFQFQLAELAFDEVRKDGLCFYCGGTGARGEEGTYKACGRCGGSGKLALPAHVKYEALCLPVRVSNGEVTLNFSKHAWMKTWSRRYDEIFSEVRSWLVEFNEKIIRHFE